LYYIEVDSELTKHAKALGKRGGIARNKNLSPIKRRIIARKGAIARNAKRKTKLISPIQLKKNKSHEGTISDSFNELLSVTLKSLGYKLLDYADKIDTKKHKKTIHKNKEKEVALSLSFDIV